MKFRFHRGGLDDSMKTQVLIFTEVHLKKHIEKHIPSFKGDLQFKHIGFDDRIGWDTWYVLGDCFGEKNIVIGMADTGSFISAIKTKSNVTRNT